MSGRPTRNRRPDQVTPLVTVVIPAYNVEQWIFATIESVLKQTYKPVEVVVVNDGSRDGTAEVIAGFGDGVRCVAQPNKVSLRPATLALGWPKESLLLSWTPMILWMPEKLEHQVELLRRFPEIGWVYSDAFVVDPTATIVLNRVGEDVAPSKWRYPTSVDPSQLHPMPNSVSPQVGARSGRRV